MARRASKIARPKRRWPKLVIAIIAIIAGLGILSAASAATAMQLENHDDFCASCHSEPESTFFQRAMASQSTDLASFHTTKDVRCIDCHSGPGLIPGRISAITLGAKDLLAWISGHATQPAVNTRPIDDANCLKCHAAVTQQRDFNNHFHAFLSRWQAVDQNAATCVSCHQSHTTTGEAQLAFLNRDDTVAVCQKCHQVLRGE